MIAKIVVGSGVAARDEGMLNSFLDEGWSLSSVYANGPKPWFVLVQHPLRQTSMKDLVGIGEDSVPELLTPKKKGRPKKVK